ncbi:unnamed protein product [Withania somnifera]
MDLNLKETELCLGLPGGGELLRDQNNIKKRVFSETVDLKLNLQSTSDSPVVKDQKMKNLPKENSCNKDNVKPPTKAQVVGWPPVRSFRKNVFFQKGNNNNEDISEKGGRTIAFVKMYKNYQQLSDSLAKMFSSFTVGTSIIPYTN